MTIEFLMALIRSAVWIASNGISFYYFNRTKLETTMKVWTRYEDSSTSENIYWFFQLKDGRWFRYVVLKHQWEELRNQPQVSDGRFKKAQAAAVEHEWYKMMGDGAPFDLADIAD